MSAAPEILSTRSTTRTMRRPRASDESHHSMLTDGQANPAIPDVELKKHGFLFSCDEPREGEDARGFRFG